MGKYRRSHASQITHESFVPMTYDYIAETAHVAKVPEGLEVVMPTGDNLSRPRLAFVTCIQWNPPALPY